MALPSANTIQMQSRTPAVFTVRNLKVAETVVAKRVQPGRGSRVKQGPILATSSLQVSGAGLGDSICIFCSRVRARPFGDNNQGWPSRHALQKQQTSSSRAQAFGPFSNQDGELRGNVLRPGSWRQAGRHCSLRRIGVDSEKNDWGRGLAVDSRHSAADASHSGGQISHHDSGLNSLHHSPNDKQGRLQEDHLHSNAFQPVQNSAQIDSLEHSHGHDHGHHEHQEHRHGHSQGHSHSDEHDQGHEQGHGGDHNHAQGHTSEHEHEHGYGHGHQSSHNHSHENGHSHCNGGHSHGGVEGVHDPNRLQAAILAVAKAVRWYQLANLLRESLPVAFGASALLLCSFLAPRVLPMAIGAKIGTGLVTAVFGLIGTPALLDSMVDLAGGHINIHVLMALAAFASVAMGSPLEGALLLCLFTVSHAGERGIGGSGNKSFVKITGRTGGEPRLQIWPELGRFF